jgi:hypothetical protein
MKRRLVAKNMYYSRQFIEGLFGRDGINTFPIPCNAMMMVDGVVLEDRYAVSCLQALLF